MSPARRTASVLLGLALAVASLKLAACSALDPVPPDPHEEDFDGGDEPAIHEPIMADFISGIPPNPHALTRDK